MGEIEILKKWIKESSNVVFFGGAGVSTGSGIPDFRGGDGLYSKTYNEHSPEEILNERFFYAHPNKFYDYYWKHFIFENAEPNKTHEVLAELEDLGHIKTIITQNVDNLHKEAGSGSVLELHGTNSSYQCIFCRAKYSLDEAKECIIDESLVPKCDYCDGILKPQVTLFGGLLNGEIMKKAEIAITMADVLIVAGTSLSVQPAASLVEGYNGTKFVIINNSVTPYDDIANLVIYDDIETVFSKLL